MDRWAVLEVARDSLLEGFADAGVVRIEYVVGFVAPYLVHVWLGTTSDVERDALAAVVGLEGRTESVLNSSGLAQADSLFGGVVIQSQETVDRDYDGSWFYALR